MKKNVLNPVYFISRDALDLEVGSLKESIKMHNQQKFEDDDKIR